MMKSIKAMLKRSKERYRVPRCVRDVIPVQAMWKDGVFRVGNRYSIEDNVKKFKIEKIIFANPSCPPADKKEILDICADDNDPIVLRVERLESNKGNEFITCALV